MLTPVGAEVLTRKFEEIDQLNTKEDRYMLILFHQLFCEKGQNLYSNAICFLSLQEQILPGFL